MAALFVALFWGLNFTSIYPVLKLLHTEQSPQDWINEQIGLLGTKCQRSGDRNRTGPAHERLLDQQSENNSREREKRRGQFARRNWKTVRRLKRNKLYWHQVGRKYIYKFAPPDCYQTLMWLIGLVVVGVTIKCFFEFGAGPLVGSVVNLSLFDLRNRFYRNVIHLDVDQFGKDGTGELMARFTNDMESVGTGLKMLFGKLVAEPLRSAGAHRGGHVDQLAAYLDVLDSRADRRLHPTLAKRAS